MKSIYISLPITGHEDTYEQRLDAAVEYVKTNYPEYDRIITPKEVAENLEKLFHPFEPKYYLLADIRVVSHCDAIFMCREWYYSKGCFAERAFAGAIGLTILYQRNFI